MFGLLCVLFFLAIFSFLISYLYSYTQTLVSSLNEKTFLAIIGASGSGKSSLVRAGLIPALQGFQVLVDNVHPPMGSASWPVHIVLPSQNPLKPLAASITWDSKSVLDQAVLMDDMSKDHRSLDFAVHRILSNQASGAKRLLLIVDQFEELFTRCRDKNTRQAFIDNLLTAAFGGATTVVITLRADFYHHCSEFDNLRQAVQDHQIYIGAMRSDELRQAIEEPARVGKWELEAGLVDLLLNDVADQPGGLPLLSHALLETWKRREGRALTLAGYQDSGAVRGAIARTADEAFRSMTPNQQTVAKRVFLRLTELGEGVQDTRRRTSLKELVQRTGEVVTVEDVIKRLVDVRLLTTSQEPQVKDEFVTADMADLRASNDRKSDDLTVYVEVAHEALIREWSTLREWLADDREGLRLHRHLTDAAQEWQGLDKDPSELYRGARLEQAVSWADEHRDDLNILEQEFLDASVALVEADRRERELIRQEREDARQKALEQAQLLLREEEARRQAEEQRAREAELAAKILKRRAWYLGVALAIALSTGIATGWFFQVAKQNEAWAKDVASAMGDLLGLKLTDDLSDIRRQVAILLIRRGENSARRGQFDAAADNFRMALSLDPPSDTPVYVWIEPGNYLMGTDSPSSSDDEKPSHQVELDGYWILRTEVTNTQYQLCVMAGVCEPPADPKWDGPDLGQHPVANVNWNQAATYAQWVGGRLPTEAEWEVACRGPDGFLYPWGNDEPSSVLLNYNQNVGTTAPVGSYASGANGLYDMAGNVYEWTGDQYDRFYYSRSPLKNPSGPANGLGRTLRGGAWDFSGDHVRCTNRRWDHSTNSVDGFGFRVVISRK